MLPPGLEPSSLYKHIQHRAEFITSLFFFCNAWLSVSPKAKLAAKIYGELCMFASGEAARDKVDLHEDEGDCRDATCFNGMEFQYLADHFKKELGVKRT